MLILTVDQWPEHVSRPTKILNKSPPYIFEIRVKTLIDTNYTLKTDITWPVYSEPVRWSAKFLLFGGFVFFPLLLMELIIIHYSIRADASASMVTLSSPSPSLSCVESGSYKSSHVSRVLISGPDENHAESSEPKILRDVHIVRFKNRFF